MVKKSVLLVAVDDRDNPENYKTSNGHILTKNQIIKDIEEKIRTYQTLDDRTNTIATVKVIAGVNLGTIQDETEGNNLNFLKEFDL